MGVLRLGVDVGGTRLKFAALRGTEVVARHLEPTPTDSAEALTIALARGCGHVAAAAGGAVEAVGLGVAGVLSTDGRRLLQSPNMPWLDGYALADALERQLAGPRVVADNDANCVGWGEARIGAGAGASRQACLALGTGLGGALIFAGWLLRGDHGRGAELGHLVVEPDGPACGCGGHGCAEQFASQTGLLRMMCAAGLASAGEPAPQAVGRLFAGARSGDRATAAIVQRAATALGQVVARLDATFDLDLVVVAGGLAHSLDLLGPPALATAKRLRGGRAPELSAGTLGDDAGPVGAALLIDAPRPAATTAACG